MISKLPQTLLIILSFSLVLTSDTNMTLSNTIVKVSEQGGKISISTVSSDSNSTTESVTINFSSLKEKNDRGEEIGKSAMINHFFNNFSQLNFTVGPFISTTYQRKKAYSVDIRANDIIKNGTNFLATIHIFNETGSIDMGGADYAGVKKGTVKFSVMVENWPFCQKSNDTVCEGIHCCQQGEESEVGKYLDFEFEITGNKAATCVQNSTKTAKQ